MAGTADASLDRSRGQFEGVPSDQMENNLTIYLDNDANKL